MGVCFSSALSARSRSQGSSFKNRMQVSNVAPPHASTEKKPQVIDLPCERDHIFSAEAGGNERLVGIAKSGISDKNFTRNGSITWETSGPPVLQLASQNFNW